MFKYKIILILFGATLLLTTTGCIKGFSDVNVNPDVPLEVPPAQLLSAAEGDLATTQAGDIARYTAMITQQLKGADRQFIGLNAYSYTNDAFDAMWKNTYAGHLNNLNIIMKKSDAAGYNTYSGISRCLTAYSLLQMTDLFGSIPYSDAFQGATNLQSKFDSQVQIYATAHKLLDDGIAKLKLSATTPGFLVPSSDDIIYGGDATKWIKFAHTLKARAYLHWGKTDASNYTKALAELNNADGSITMNTDDARFKFFGGQPGGAPMYQFLDQRGGYLDAGDSSRAFFTTLIATGDTLRQKKYYVFVKKKLPTIKFSYWTMNVPHPYFTETQAVPLLTALEAKFIRAECEFRTGNAAAAASFKAAIEQSFSDLGITGAAVTAYVAAQPIATPALKDIMEQKYLALYCDPEVFTDWRRTGFPTITPTGPAVPRRFLYPTSEINLNSNTPAAGLTDRVTWDQ